VLISAGLKENEKVLLSVPAGMDADQVNLLEQLNGKRSKKDEASQSRVAPKETADSNPSAKK
jgi:hypothetical protein